MSIPRRKSVLIAGAGIAGLAAGTWLSKNGYDVRIVEATSRPGGRAVTVCRSDGSEDLADAGTQYFHSNYRLARALCADAGLSTRLTKVRGKTRFFDHRAPDGTFTTGHRIPTIKAGSVFDNLRLLIRGLIRMALSPMNPYAVLRQRPSDSESVSNIITDPFEWDFTARTLISAGALVEPDGREISYLHMIRLMRIILMTDYLALDTGTASLHEALAANLSISYNVSAKKLIHSQDRSGLELSDGEHLFADHVVLAVPPGVCSMLLPPDWKEEQEFLSAIDHPPAIVVTLFLDCTLERNVWSYVFPYDPNRTVSFCVDTAQKCPAMAPSGRSALQAWICAPAALQLIVESDKTALDLVVRELTIFFPDLANHIQETNVQRHQHAVPQFPPGHNQASEKFLCSVDARPNVQICGDFLSGGYVESALWAAERAVQKIVKAEQT